ncbi:hypothetical protein G3I23_35195, partial [Streptomyces sp. SID10115]
LLVPSAGGPVPYYDSDAVDARWRLLGYGAVVPDNGATMIATARDGFRAPGPAAPSGGGLKKFRTKVS